MAFSKKKIIHRSFDEVAEAMQSSDEELDESMMDEEPFVIEDEEMNSYAPSEESESSASDVDSEEDNEYFLSLDPSRKSMQMKNDYKHLTKVSKTFAHPEICRKYVVWYSTSYGSAQWVFQ